MNRRTSVAAGLLLWLGLTTAVSTAHAQGAVPTEQQQLASLLTSPTYRTFLETAVMNVESPVLKARCAQIKIIDANRFSVILPPTFSPGAINTGMWISVLNVDRCGAPATRRILVQVGGPNALSPTAMLPGEFRGDIRLESDISRAMTRDMMSFSQCQDVTRFAISDIKAVGAGTPEGWSETWLGESCGKIVSATVDYARSLAGAVSYAARDFRAL
ncbi:MAG: hypothetical protein EXQ93_00655 [Alphaproteobacteria bacterium]|nr:hypothetical protein [Alphaproteobacteria bacterium]